MADPNINRPEWDMDLAEAPFRSRVMQLGRHAGAEEIGVSLYEIDAGGAVSPYHVHHGNEELLLVLSGSPSCGRRAGPGASSPAPRWRSRAARRVPTG